MRRKHIYIAATAQHVGKTTMTLGLVAALKSRALNVGYCKPLGQQFLDVEGGRVDKDAVLFSDCMSFELLPEIHSPVILGSGDTARYLDDPKPDGLRKRIAAASEVLDRNHDVVVFEGTGHPGVGSVVGLSNADVAQQLEADVVLVLEGGIGNTLDRLALCRAMFDAAGVGIIGAVVNKVHRSKIEKIRRYLQIGMADSGVDLLGIVPYDDELVYPSMRNIVKAVNGEVLTGDAHLSNVVSDTIAGLTMEFESHTDPAKLLLVVTHRRLDEALKNFQTLCRARQLPFHMAGIIITQAGELTKKQMNHCTKYGIPVAATPFDTYDTVVRMGQLVAKIDTRNKVKIERAIALFREHVDLSRIVNSS